MGALPRRRLVSRGGVAVAAGELDAEVAGTARSLDRKSDGAAGSSPWWARRLLLPLRPPLLWAAGTWCGDALVAAVGVEAGVPVFLRTVTSGDSGTSS